MPWDPKPETTIRHTNGAPTNGSQAPYHGYDVASNGTTIKTEPGVDQYQNNQAPSTYTAMQPQQGGMARAQELVEQRFGPQAAAAIQRPGGLALPGQQQSKPQGLQLPGQGMTPQQQQQQQYSQQQQQQILQRQQQALQAQQATQRIKVESDASPVTAQGQFAQPAAAAANYAQTDGADDLSQWQALMAHRRSLEASQIAMNDRLIRDQIAGLADELQSGLMVPLKQNEARIAARNHRMARLQPVLEQPGNESNQRSTVIAQLDGDDDDDDEKPDLKADDEDEDAINSDLDDPEDDLNPIGDDEDELGDTILCTYDKVQRVKNKWKCTLKDGVLNTGGKEWLFHKGQGLSCALL